MNRPTLVMTAKLI